MSGYDEKLLGSAPATTKAERQQGYDAALLEKGPTPPPLTNPALPSPHGRRVHAGAQYGTGSTHGHTALDPPPNPVYNKQLPFWKTRKGKITVAAIALLIVAIVAGVVGGVVGSRKGSNSQAQMAGPANDGPVSTTSSAHPTQDSSPSSSGSLAAIGSGTPPLGTGTVSGGTQTSTRRLDGGPLPTLPLPSSIPMEPSTTPDSDPTNPSPNSPTESISR